MGRLDTRLNLASAALRARCCVPWLPEEAALASFYGGPTTPWLARLLRRQLIAGCRRDVIGNDIDLELLCAPAIIDDELDTFWSAEQRGGHDDSMGAGWHYRNIHPIDSSARSHGVTFMANHIQVPPFIASRVSQIGEALPDKEYYQCRLGAASVNLTRESLLLRSVGVLLASYSVRKPCRAAVVLLRGWLDGRYFRSW